MTINSTMKVRDVVLDLPNAKRVLEKLRIDYCCGGDRRLGEACEVAGVDVVDLIRMLDEAKKSVKENNGHLEFQKVTLNELAEYIVSKHHVYTKEEMARLTSLIDKVIGAHGVNHPELKQLGDVFRRLCEDLKPHMFKEEQILFPYILRMENAARDSKPAPMAPFGTINNPVRMMKVEHDTAGDALRAMRELTSNYAVPPDGCISYQTLYQALEAFEQDLHQHIHLENNILFPKAIALEENQSCSLGRQF